MQDSNFVSLALALIGGLVALFGGAMGLVTYMRDVRHKQTDWLYQLFDRFYEKNTYKTMRRRLDRPNADEMGQLEADVRTDPDVEDAFSDYLNFFEFICNLEQDRRMKRHDVDALFDYYLNSLARLPFVTDYVATNGFEALDKELRRRAGGLS